MKKVVFWLHRFVVAYGIIMLSTFFMYLLFNPTSELPVVSFFSRCILFTLVCMATLVVYASRMELTLRGWWIRTILHAALLEAVLLPLAHYWNFWYGPLDAVIYACFILAAKILWHLINFGQSIRTATQINKQLLRRHDRQEQEGSEWKN